MSSNMVNIHNYLCWLHVSILLSYIYVYFVSLFIFFSFQNYIHPPYVYDDMKQAKKDVTFFVREALFGFSFVVPITVGLIN